MNRVAHRLARGRRLGFGLLVTGISLGAGLLVAASAELKPQPYDRLITRTIARLVADEHLSKHALNGEISERTFLTYLKTLDPMKVYFMQSDIDEFSKQKTTLADSIKRGDVSFAYDVYSRFLQRVDQRVALIDSILAKPMDLHVDEDLMTDPKLTVYAKTDDEMRDKWRRRIKFDELAKIADKAEDAKKPATADGKTASGADSHATSNHHASDSTGTPEERISKRYHSFAKRMHQTTPDELLERYLTAFTSSFDPHTSYMSASTLDDFDINMRLQLEGIGAALKYELDDGCTKVSQLIPGGPAEKDGRLKPEDKVIGVGQGLNGEIVDVADLPLKEVVNLIRGKAGSVVRIKVQPTIGGEPKIVDITRASIELKDAEARSEVFEEGHKADGTPYKIGVIDLPSFYMDMKGAQLGVNDYRSTTRDVQRLLDDFKTKGVDAVVIDLRRNGGGSLVEAVSLTGLFIDEGTVVQVKDHDGRVQQYPDLDKGVAWGGPLVVLQSKFSASASEIFAGAIQDYGRGIIVGDRTSHGKGTVQQLLDVGAPIFSGGSNAPKLGALKITIQQFYRPNGDSTQNRGVVSDIELPSMTSHFDVGESDLDYATKFDHIDPAKYVKANSVNKALIDELRERSIHRVHDSEDFQKLEKQIDRYVQLKERKTVPLDEDKFLAERAELNTEREEEKQFEQLDEQNRPVVNRDFYFNEALAITLDYLQLNGHASPNGVASGRRAVPSVP
jgi:carboxyl-terminal processing protease